MDLDTGQQTQSWLAVSEDPAALVSGRYWHHLKQQQPAKEAVDPEFQDELPADRRDASTGLEAFRRAGKAAHLAVQTRWCRSPVVMCGLYRARVPVSGSVWTFGAGIADAVQDLRNLSRCGLWRDARRSGVR